MTGYILDLMFIRGHDTLVVAAGFIGKLCIHGLRSKHDLKSLYCGSCSDFQILKM